MNKTLRLLCIAMAATFSAWSQVKVGDIAPDFTLKDINNQTHHLYSYLDSGYTVIIDLSAAWCAPCWAGHNSHVFNDLVDHYGRTGSIAPGKVKVLFIEGESKNTTAQLYGIPSATQKTQGDWVAGTNYPIIDSSAVNSSYLYQGYPSYTVICRDRMVAATVLGYTADMDEAFWMKHVAGSCPDYAPSSTVDAKAWHYNDTDFYYCQASPVVRFQNYSAKALTSATINMYSGSTLVATQPWTGNLAPYAVAAVPVSPFTAATFSDYSFEVKASGDTRTTNDRSRDSLFKLYNAATARPVPYREGFEWKEPFAYYYSTIGATTIYSWSPVIGLTDSVTGPAGTPTRAMKLDYGSFVFNTPAEFVYGSYNTADASNLAIEFDYAYCGLNSSTNAMLEVLVSTDCGASWSSVRQLTGAAFATMSPVSNYPIPVPSASSHWRHASISLAAYKDTNLLVKVRGLKTSFIYGSGWIDNLNLTGTLDVPHAAAAGELSLSPNPARDEALLTFSLYKNTRVRIDVVDATGRVVSAIAPAVLQAGGQTMRISTAALPAGLYQVMLRTDEGVLTQRLAVLK